MDALKDRKPLTIYKTIAGEKIEIAKMSPQELQVSFLDISHRLLKLHNRMGVLAEVQEALENAAADKGINLEYPVKNENTSAGQFFKNEKHLKEST